MAKQEGVSAGGWKKQGVTAVCRAVVHRPSGSAQVAGAGPVKLVSLYHLERDEKG